MLLIIFLSVSFLTLTECQELLPAVSKDSVCYQYQCSIGKVCQAINQKPICKCNHNCKDSEKTGPLCGKNGKTYEHLCSLKKAECELGIFIKVEHYGNCTRQEPCHDSRRENELGLCKVWAAFGSCTQHVELMKKYCKKTCKMCKGGKQPLACEKSRYGCCYESKLPALGTNQKACYKDGGSCDDGSRCKFFPHFCGSKINTETMRKYCPYTCRFCVPLQQNNTSNGL